MDDAVKITTVNARVAIELYAGLVALGWTPPGALPRPAPASHRCTLEQRTEMAWTAPLMYFPRYRAKCMDTECRWRGDWRISPIVAQSDGYEHEVAPLETPTVGRSGGSAPTVDGPERVAPEPTGER